MIWTAIGVVVSILAFFIVRNGLKNRDPHNRKCAAEICELIANRDNPAHEDFTEVFMRNARYRKQAMHVASMVPSLLINAGYPKEFSMSVVTVLTQSAMMVPE